MEPADNVQEALRTRARVDHPLGEFAWVDAAAWMRAEGEGSAAAAAAIKRTDFEAWIPGLPARRTVMTMGWAILIVVIAAESLSWLAPFPWVETVGNVMIFGIGALAVAAAGWSIVSEMRGWEGSDASRWLLKSRVKKFRKKLEMRRGEVCHTVIAVTENKIVIYGIEDDAIISRDYTQGTVDSLSIERSAAHTTLRFTTAVEKQTFEWLFRDPSFEAAVERLAVRLAMTKGPRTGGNDCRMTADLPS